MEMPSYWIIWARKGHENMEYLERKKLFQQSLLTSNQHVTNLIWHYDNEFISWCSYDFVTSTCLCEYGNFLYRIRPSWWHSFGVMLQRVIVILSWYSSNTWKQIFPKLGEGTSGWPCSLKWKSTRTFKEAFRYQWKCSQDIKHKMFPSQIRGYQSDLIQRQSADRNFFTLGGWS